MRDRATDWQSKVDHETDGWTEPELRALIEAVENRIAALHRTDPRSRTAEGRAEIMAELGIE